MRRVTAAAAELSWLDDPPENAVTGYDQGGWPASVWILHAMYHHGALDGSGSHDDLHRERLRRGEVSPETVGGVDLETTTATGIPLGFVRRPAEPWRRLRWRDHLAADGRFPPDLPVPPCHRWFPHASWPLSIHPPPMGSLDEASLDALVTALAEHSAHGHDTECLAFYGALAAGDFDETHVWAGPLGAIAELVDENGGAYGSTPANFWPRDRSWFVWTDWDLLATKVSAAPALVDALTASSRLETVGWPSARSPR
jgi:hypothetical protein